LGCALGLKEHGVFPSCHLHFNYKRIQAENVPDKMAPTMLLAMLFRYIFLVVMRLPAEMRQVAGSV